MINRNSANAQTIKFSPHTIVVLAPLLFLYTVYWLFTAPPTLAQSDVLTPPAITNEAVVRVWAESAQDLDLLRQAYDVWDHGNHNPNDPWVLIHVSPAQYDMLRQSGRRIELDIAFTTQLNQPPEFDPLQVSGIPGYDCYRTVDETFTTLDTLNATYPDLVELVDLGDSWAKVQDSADGYDIRGIVITNEAIGGTKPKFFMMAATHAREYATAELVTRFAEHMVQNYGSDPDVTWMLDYFELHIVPQANPDGRVVAQSADIWHRKNLNTAYCSGSNLGVDLNRNMSWEWTFATSNTCSNAYQGQSSLSEPENIAIATYAQNIFPDLRGTGITDAAPDTLDGIFITVHSHGGYVLPTWAYTSAPSSPNASGIYTLGRKMGYYNQYNVCGTGECFSAASGTHDDFVYGELGVPSYTFELGNAFHQSCSSFTSTIYPDNFDALFYAFKATRRAYQTPSGPEVTAISGTPIGGGVAGSQGITLTSSNGFTLTVTVDDTRYDSNGWGNEPTQAIAEVRYSVNFPSWVTGTSTVTLSADDGAFDSTVESASVLVPTTIWPLGRHLVLVEGRDADGNWGVPSAYWVTITSVPTNTQLTYLPIVSNGAAGRSMLNGISAETVSILLSTSLLAITTLVGVRPRRRNQLIK